MVYWMFVRLTMWTTTHLMIKQILFLMLLFVQPFTGSGELTITAPNATPGTRVFVLPYKYSVAYEFDNVAKEI